MRTYLSAVLSGSITGAGLGLGFQFRAAFPLARYVPIEPNALLPFEAGRFQIATSNALLEHVVSLENQIYFIRELCRVARKVFINDAKPAAVGYTGLLAGPFSSNLYLALTHEPR